MRYEDIIDPAAAIAWLGRLVKKYNFVLRREDGTLLPVVAYNSAPHITVGVGRDVGSRETAARRGL